MESLHVLVISKCRWQRKTRFNIYVTPLWPSEWEFCLLPTGSCPLPLLAFIQRSVLLHFLQEFQLGDGWSSNCLWPSGSYPSFLKDKRSPNLGSASVHPWGWEYGLVSVGTDRANHMLALNFSVGTSNGSLRCTWLSWAFQRWSKPLASQVWLALCVTSDYTSTTIKYSQNGQALMSSP